MADPRFPARDAPAPFRLSSVERARLAPDLDPDALERLVGKLPAQGRDFFLAMCRDWARLGPEAIQEARETVFRDISDFPMSGGGRGWASPSLDALELDDPALQAELDALLEPRRARYREEFGWT